MAVLRITAFLYVKLRVSHARFKIWPVRNYEIIA